VAGGGAGVRAKVVLEGVSFTTNLTKKRINRYGGLTAGHNAG